jgi:hypothetical protein
MLCGSASRTDMRMSAAGLRTYTRYLNQGMNQGRLLKGLIYQSKVHTSGLWCEMPLFGDVARAFEEASCIIMERPESELGSRPDWMYRDMDLILPTCPVTCPHIQPFELERYRYFPCSGTFENPIIASALFLSHSGSGRPWWVQLMTKLTSPRPSKSAYPSPTRERSIAKKGTKCI